MRLAIVTSHPVQYYAPWFQQIARDTSCSLRVFYLWDFGVSPRHDPGFHTSFTWDVPLLGGYDHEFVPNLSRHPGTSSFSGLHNPLLLPRLRKWNPGALLLIGFNHRSFLELILRWPRRLAPLLLRGDSHRLAPRTGPSARAKDTLASLLFRRVSAFLCCGQANRDYFLHRGARPSQLFFCPHAIDTTRFHASPQLRGQALAWRSGLGIPDNHRLVLFAGKFEEKKRPLDLLQAFHDARLDGASLLFAGSGPLEHSLRRAAAGRPHVHFTPFQNQSRMPMVYHAADVLVLPSLGPSETWGLAIQEALACGIPAIVSSHVGCHPDLIRDKNCGEVFPAGDTAALAAALRRALGPEFLASYWRQHAAAAIRGYDYPAATRGLLAALKSLEP